MMNTWQTTPLTVDNQDVHFTRSEQFLREIQPNDPPILYWSMADQDGLVLGFSQKESVLNQQVVERLQLPIYHRRAGGTAVLVGSHLLALDAILPESHPLVQNDVVESYRWFGEVWVQTLASFGVMTEAISPELAHWHRERLKQPETRPTEQLLNRACYGTLSPYEVVIGERKIVGLCMVRRKTGILLQAGLLLDWHAPLIAELLGHTPEEQAYLAAHLPERAVGLREVQQSSISAKEIISRFQEVVLHYTQEVIVN